MKLKPTAFRYKLEALFLKPVCSVKVCEIFEVFILNSVLGLFSLTCKQSFEGAEGNLQRLMEKNAHWLEQQPVDDTISVQHADRIHRLIARFLLLVDIWFFDKKSLVESHQVRFL